MKTKHRILSVLTILAMVASLTAVMVAPAAAITPPTVAVVPPSADVVGEYTITFAVTRGLEVGHIIVVTFPAGTVVPRATAAVAGNIYVGPHPTTLDGTVVGRSVILPVPEAIPAGDIVRVRFTAAAGIVNPPVAGDDYTVMVRTQTEPVDVTSAAYTIRGINLSPARGPSGTVVDIAGYGFAGGTAGAITGPDAVIARVPFRTTADGRIVATATIRAGAPAGAHIFTATVNGVSETATFTVTVPAAVITLTPAKGPIGTLVTITGKNFPIVRAGSVEAAGVITPVTFTTTAAGEIPTGITARILTTAPHGAQTFTVSVNGVSDTATFTVEAPAITLSPTSGMPGETVKVTGIGFVPFGTLDRLMIGTATVTPIPTEITDSVGNFVATFVVPGITPGPQTVKAWVGAVDDGATFTITAPPPIIPVEVGLAALLRMQVLGHSVFFYDDGVWLQHLVIAPDRVPDAVRLTQLERGKGYWIYLTEDIEDVHFGGMTRSLRAGWHMIGW